MRFVNDLPMRNRYTPTVQELRSLVACGELGSASRAAEALNLTQSAVSRAIRSLEDRLGVRLFQRVRQRLILSDAGRAMLHDAATILDSLDKSAQMVMAFGGSERVLRLAVLPTFATTWLIPRLEEFHRAFPDITFDLTSALNPIDFHDSPFDAAIQRAALARPGTAVIPLMQERLIVVGSSLRTWNVARSLDEIIKYPLIQQATRPGLWPEWFAAAGLEPIERLRGPRFQHFDMVIAAAHAGLGLALLPEIFVQKYIEEGTLRQVVEFSHAGPAPYALIYPASREMSAALQLFADWLQTGT